jgi:hypothetical protein
MVRKAFDKYDEPVNIDMEPEEALQVLLHTPKIPKEPEGDCP